MLSTGWLTLREFVLRELLDSVFDLMLYKRVGFPSPTPESKAWKSGANIYTNIWSHGIMPRVTINKSAIRHFSSK